MSNTSLAKRTLREAVECLWTCGVSYPPRAMVHSAFHLKPTYKDTDNGCILRNLAQVLFTAPNKKRSPFEYAAQNERDHRVVDMFLAVLVLASATDTANRRKVRKLLTKAFAEETSLQLTQEDFASETETPTPCCFGGRQRRRRCRRWRWQILL